MIYKWIGGPMDGCHVEIDGENQKDTDGQIGKFLWHGPDPSEPFSKLITYGMFSTEDKNVREYRYDQRLTDRANEFIMEQRKIAEN